MSTFEVMVRPIQILNHPDADSLEIAQVLGYQCVVRKGLWQDGLAVYIPEQALVPQNILEEMGLVGMLAGPEKNRVTARRFRGVFSQGLLYPARPEWVEGQDVAQELGITKWVPEISPNLRGQSVMARNPITFKYDIENIKNRPNQIEEGELVQMTEKLHGTFTVFGVAPQDMEQYGSNLFVSSKGRFARGELLDLKVESLYVNFALQNNVEQKIRAAFQSEIDAGNPVYVMGELFGPVQDLKYGGKLQFRVFDIYIGMPNKGRFVDSADLGLYCAQMGLDRVPVLYTGPLTKEALEAATNGKETISGKGLHIREGVVVCTLREKTHPRYGRCKLKSVSPAYLLRSNGTEME